MWPENKSLEILTVNFKDLCCEYWNSVEWFLLVHIGLINNWNASYCLISFMILLGPHLSWCLRWGGVWQSGTSQLWEPVTLGLEPWADPAALWRAHHQHQEGVRPRWSAGPGRCDLWEHAEGPRWRGGRLHWSVHMFSNTLQLQNEIWMFSHPKDTKISIIQSQFSGVLSFCRSDTKMF